jgi:hypothetical protein
VYVVLFPAIPLLGGGPRALAVLRCRSAKLRASCTGSFKLLCLLPEDCVFWNFQNVHNGEETETINETEELAPPTQLGNVKSSKSTRQCQVFETRRIECFDLR